MEVVASAIELAEVVATFAIGNSVVVANLADKAANDMLWLITSP